MITALCGGVGGSKLVLGLYRTLPANTLTVVVNTADDLQFCGLHVSPDLDTVVYTLAGVTRRDVGWGIEGDTFRALEMLGRYGAPTWFHVGDTDLATHVFRTCCLREGSSLTEVTGIVERTHGLHARVLPMSDDPIATRLLVGDEWLDFQDYFVHRGHRDPVEAVRYDGVERATACQSALDAIRESEIVVLVNSNPALSILPIISVPGMRDALEATAARRVAVSPIVGMSAVTGPAGDLMRLLGQPSSATGVAGAYRGMVDGLVVDRQDAGQAAAIEGLGIRVLVTDTIMRDAEGRDRLATKTVDFARSLR